MSLIVYANGIIEDFYPINHTYTEQDLVKIFDDYEEVNSKRLDEPTDTWCLWGENQQEKETDYNRLGSDIIDFDVYSPLVFIHDTEINPDWNITNNPILKNYSDFKEKMAVLIEGTATAIIKADQEQRKQSGDTNMLILTTVGPTEDKKVLYDFNPDVQNESFYLPANFELFLSRVWDYILKNYKKDNPFQIYSDDKIMIMISNQNIDSFLNMINNHFQKKELYEKCVEVKNIQTYVNKKIQKAIKNTTPKTEKKPRKKNVKKDNQINNKKAED